MKLFNNTPNDAYWSVSYANSAACGTIKANETLDHPAFDNQQNVKVSFSALGKAPPGETPPFSVTIAKSGKGKAVTIGLFQQ